MIFIKYFLYVKIVVRSINIRFIFEKMMYIYLIVIDERKNKVVILILINYLIIKGVNERKVEDGYKDENGYKEEIFVENV